MFSKLDLKGRKDLLENLRFLLLHEDELIREGWFTPEDFFKAVVECYTEALKQSEK